MELYEAIINDVLCYNLEQHVAFVVRIKAPAYQMFNENADAEFKKMDLTGVKRRNRIRACCGKNLTAFPIFKFSSLLIQ